MFLFCIILYTQEKLRLQKNKMLYKTVDLWTEPHTNYQSLFDGGFSDGINQADFPFDKYKIVYNCNCVISYDYDINITNKHQAIVFYKRSLPVRLMVINKDTDVKTCIETALQQPFLTSNLKDLYQKNTIQKYVIDLKQQPIFNKADAAKEIDVCSCDRINLLYSMLHGNYKEDDYKGRDGFQTNQWDFIPHMSMTYRLTTDTESFVISHQCAFINKTRKSIIPVQKESSLVLDSSFQKFANVRN